MSLLSQSLLLRYPPSIQSAVLNDDDFTQRLGLGTVRVFTFRNSVTVSDEQLFTSVRTAFWKSEGSTFEDRKGQQIRIYVHEDSVERREPMFSALMVTKASLRGEVLGRLAQMHEQYSQTTEPLPDFQAVEDAWLRAPVKEMPLMCMSPGPLEGTKRPKITTTEKFPALSKEHILNELEAKPVGSVWSWLAQLAQTSRLDKDILAAGRDAVRHALLPDDVSPRHLGLSDALLVAISTPDIELRDAIAERLVGLADRVASDQDGAWLAQTIVLASAALQNDVEWENWLAKMLSDVAARLPIKKECLLAFISTLEAIETVGPSRAGITAKARAIATAGL
jgi:hypothetical protein